MMKAVIFDIDGVLLDSFEANLKFFQDLLSQAGYEPPTREELRPIFHYSMIDTIKALTQSREEEEICRLWEIGRRQEGVKYDLGLLTMPTGTAAVIKTLSENYSLGIVTSRVKNSIYELPLLAGLRDYFRATVAYEDTKQHKPDPEPLLLAASQLGAAPATCVYIGDVENDLQAARAAGMKAIIYSPSALSQADANTADFTKLPELIASL
ncbi:MAG: HAD family hydrolase [Patescibacteria group bacterium]